MSKNSFWNSLGSIIETALFLKGLPVIIVIIAILFGFAIINKTNISLQVDKDTTILHTDLESTIYQIAQNVLNTNEFSLALYDSDFYDVSLEYIIKNKSYSIEQYDKLIKEEITKIYAQIKDKKIVNDTLFGEDTIVDGDTINISIHYDDGVFSYIGFSELRYDIENKWDESYIKAMNNTIVTQKLWDEATKSKTN